MPPSFKQNRQKNYLKNRPRDCPKNRISFPFRRLSGTLLGLGLLALPAIALAHAGHGDAFSDGDSTAQVGSIQVDAQTAKRIGLKVEPVTLRQMAVGTQATGQIETLPSRQVEVTNPAGGTVVKLFVKPGDVVQQGEALAVMTSGELAELRTDALDRRAETTGLVQEAQTNLKLAQQTFAQQQQIAQAAIAQAQTDLRVAQEQYDRDQELSLQGALPPRDLLSSEAQLAAAKKAWTEAQSRLEVLNAGAERDRAQTALKVAQAREQLSMSTYNIRLQQLGAGANEDGTLTVTAPISGQIADQDVSLGQSAQDAGAPLMTIIDNSTVLATANVYEKDLKKIAIGQPVRVKVAGLPKRTFRGEVSVIGSAVADETRVVPVKAEIENADGALKPGMFAELELMGASGSAPVLAVPQSALSDMKGDMKGQPTVYVQNGSDGYVPVAVTLGRTSGDWVEVKSGVFEGDRVVTQRVAQLYAQSLRGGGNEAVAEKAVEKPVDTQKADLGSRMPDWALLLIGGAIASGAFWLSSKRALYLGLLRLLWRDRHRRFLARKRKVKIYPASVRRS
jgi:membrane fusion protein, heavy metal efflux system